MLVGLAQILALFPGVSRSGTTISFGIFAGLKRDVAFRFSFLMAIPLIIAATAINFNYAAITFAMIVGFVICFIVSLLSLKLLEMLLKRNYFWVFGVYCLTVGIIVLFQTFQ